MVRFFHVHGGRDCGYVGAARSLASYHVIRVLIERMHSALVCFCALGSYPFLFVIQQITFGVGGPVLRVCK